MYWRLTIDAPLRVFDLIGLGLSLAVTLDNVDKAVALAQIEIIVDSMQGACHPDWFEQHSWPFYMRCGDVVLCATAFASRWAEMLR